MVAGQVVAPHGVGQRILGLQPVVPGGEHAEYLAGAAGQRVGAVDTIDRQPPEYPDPHPHRPS